MKLTQFLQEAVKKRDVKSALQDENFRIGIEFEFVFQYSFPDDVRELKDKLDILFKKDIVDQVKSDISIEKESRDINKMEYAAEITTIPMSISDFVKYTPKMLNFIQENGYTNDSCGLHINISHKKFDVKDINFKKLALSLEDPKIYKNFPSREKSSAAYSSEKEMRGNKDIYLSRLGGKTDYYKYQTLHPKLNGNYIEFRGLGGEDYEDKWEHIYDMVIGYVTKLHQIFYNPNYMEKEISSFSHRTKEGVYNNDQLYDLFQRNDIEKVIISYSPSLNKNFYKKFVSNSDFLLFLDKVQELILGQNINIDRIKEKAKKVIKEIIFDGIFYLLKKSTDDEFSRFLSFIGFWYRTEDKEKFRDLLNNKGDILKRTLKNVSDHKRAEFYEFLSARFVNHSMHENMKDTIDQVFDIER